MRFRPEVTGLKEKRNSKNQLQKGAFGVHTITVTDFKVVKKSLRTKETCNSNGVKGQDIPFVPVPKKRVVPATKKGAIASVYVPFKVGSNKYSPKN